MSSTPAQLRPLGTGEILDAGIKIYRSKFATMLKAVAVVIVPVQVLNVLVTLSLPDTSTTAGATTTTSDSEWAGIAALLLIFVINREFFGWSIRLRLEPLLFVQTFALMIVTSLAAGILPARYAASRLAAEAMRLE